MIPKEAFRYLTIAGLALKLGGCGLESDDITNPTRIPSNHEQTPTAEQVNNWQYLSDVTSIDQIPSLPEFVNIDQYWTFPYSAGENVQTVINQYALIHPEILHATPGSVFRGVNTDQQEFIAVYRAVISPPILTP